MFLGQNYPCFVLVPDCKHSTNNQSGRSGDQLPTYRIFYVRKIFLYLLLLVAQGDTVSLPDRYFVHRWQLLQVYRLLLSVYSYIFIKISCFTLILLSPLFQHGIVLFRLLGKEP